MRTPSHWYKEYSLLSSLLQPLSYLWITVSFLRKTLKKKYYFSTPIICVGNVIAGGGGKTPLVIEICKYYKKNKTNIHIIYKAYKSKINNKVINVNSLQNNNYIDDEAILISKYAETWVCKKRKYGIQAAIKSGAELIILDDGLQDTSIVKNINILVSNKNQGNGNNKIIPAGPLRETISSATRKSSCIFFYGKKDVFVKYFKNYKKNIFFGEIFINFKELVKIRRKNIIAFAGIAHPKNFFNLLDNQNINLIDTISFPDHYKYKKNDIKKILLLCKKNSAIPVTTYKDYVKIPDNLKKDFSVINIYIKFDKEKFFSFINKKIKFNV